MANLYERLVLPTLINFAMTREEATRLRAAHIPEARGVVLEVGIGSGLNLPFYTNAGHAALRRRSVCRSCSRWRGRRQPTAPFPVELFNCDADRIPLADASVDTVVVTWALCSIANPADALREMRRVLKPDGTLIFVEHGLSPDAGVRKWQNRLTPFWRVIHGRLSSEQEDGRSRARCGFYHRRLAHGVCAGAARVHVHVRRARAQIKHMANIRLAHR